MYKIPISVKIGDNEYGIRDNGDYRVILDCFSALQDADLTEQERVFASLIIFYQDLNSIEEVLVQNNLLDRLSEMYKFFNCGEEDSLTTNVPYKLIDWEQDSQLICGAINKVANTEIRSAEYIHWWTFMGYFSAIGQSLFSNVVSIREKIIKGKKLEKHEREFKRDNPKYFVWNSKSVSDAEADKLVRELWNNGDS